MEFTLNSKQRSELLLLFKIESESESVDHLIVDVEWQMNQCFLPDQGSRKVMALEKTKALEQVSEASKKLRILLQRLDKT
jgi:hypothetical protein